MSGFSTSKMLLHFLHVWKWLQMAQQTVPFVTIYHHYNFLFGTFKTCFCAEKKCKILWLFFVCFFRKKTTIWVNCSFKVNCNEVEHTMTSTTSTPLTLLMTKPAEKLFPDLKSLSIFFFLRNTLTTVGATANAAE